MTKIGLIFENNVSREFYLNINCKFRDMGTESGKEEPGPNEVYCSSCGEVIKEEAEICPECGVSNKANNNSSASDLRKYELEKIANKNITTVVLLSIFITPLGYYWVNKTGLALVNFFTFNYFFLGPIIVPFHTYSIIKSARKELEQK